MLREAGLLTGGSPQGYYAEWLKNARRQGVSPQTLVDIARRFDIGPDDFDILERMDEIADADGKSFFLMPGDFSGDDARRAVLMTYILNAGTDYGDAGRKRGVTNDFPETPYSAEEYSGSSTVRATTTGATTMTSDSCTATAAAW